MDLPALATRSPDFGKTLATAQALKSGEIQNKLLEYKLGQAKQLGEIRGKLFSGGSGEATGGGQAAMGGLSVNSDLMKRYLAVDPEGGAKIISALDKMDTAERKKIEDRAKMAAGLAYQIQSAPEEQRPMLYAQALASGDKLGMDLSHLPRQYNPQVVQRLLMQNAAIADYAKIKASTKEPVVKVMGPKGPRYVKQSEAAGQIPYDEQIVEVADPNSPTGTRYISRSEAAGMAGKPPSGLNVQFKDGKLQSITTGRGAGGMGKKTANEIEGRVFNANEALSRLDQIASTFKPEFQTFETRGAAWWTALKEKAGGRLGNVSPAERTQLTEYSDYKRNAIENINLYIKDLSGAAVSAQEATRLRAGLPDPGDGIFDGDSPTEFASKMRSTVGSLKRALARYNYALNQGLDPQNTGITLKGIEKIMRDRATKLTSQIQTENPGIGADDLKTEVRSRIAAEFGLQ